MPPEKKFRKPTVINQNLWNVGDVYAYQFHKDESQIHGLYGKYVLLQKIGEGQFIRHKNDDLSKIPIMMRVHFFDKLFDRMPTLKNIEGVRLLPIGQPNIMGDLTMNTLMELEKKKDYPLA